jgi:Na+/H+-dicarboxylate symporter
MGHLPPAVQPAVPAPDQDDHRAADLRDPRRRVAGAGHVKIIGRMGLRALIYFEVVTTVALVVGLVAVNITKPGVGVNLPLGQGSEISAKPQTRDQILLHTAPESILGVDELMDLARSMTNVNGNCPATVVVTKGEGEFAEASGEELAIAGGRGEI